MRPDDTPTDAIAIAELARVARGLEAGGIYNGAKLVRALVDRDLARAGFSAPLAGGGAGHGGDRDRGPACRHQ